MKLLFENWRKYLTESALSDRLTDEMHEKWLQGYQASKGDTPRFKPVPLESGQAPEEALQRLTDEGYEKLETVDGVLNQDINQPPANIVPSLKHKLNGAPAVDYAAAVEATEVNSPEDIERLASEFHEVWMKHNDWQRDDNPSLFAPYEQLPADEKLKDLDQLEVALNLHYGSDPNVQQYFRQVYEGAR